MEVDYAQADRCISRAQCLTYLAAFVQSGSLMQARPPVCVRPGWWIHQSSQATFAPFPALPPSLTSPRLYPPTSAGRLPNAPLSAPSPVNHDRNRRC